MLEKVVEYLPAQCCLHPPTGPFFHSFIYSFLDSFAPLYSYLTKIIHLLTHRFVCSSSIHPSTNPTIHPSICLSIYPLSVCFPSICLTIPLFILLSFYALACSSISTLAHLFRPSIHLHSIRFTKPPRAYVTSPWDGEMTQT